MKFTLEQLDSAIHQANSRLSMKRLGSTTFVLSGPDAEVMNGKEYKTVSELLTRKRVNIVCDELGISSWPLKHNVYAAMKQGGMDMRSAFIKHLSYRIVEAV